METVAAAAEPSPMRHEPNLAGRGDEMSYVAPPGLVRIEVAGRPLLFSEVGQQLAELNPTADLIWRRLASGEPANEVVEGLVALDVAPGQAQDYVQSCLQGWLAGGQLLPTTVLEALAARPAATRQVGLDELEATLTFHGDANPAASDAVFGHLERKAVSQPCRLALVGDNGLIFPFLDGAPLQPAPAEGLVPAIKAALTDRYVKLVEGAFLAHGALLHRGGRTVFLSGAPGAGKTTLTLALAASGFAYGGDDIVRIEADGQACAAPFAAAVKSGAWPLVTGFAPAVATLPTWLRADGQQVRYYLPPARAPRAPRPLDAVLLLDRQAGASAALEPIHPVAALTTILESAWSARGALAADALQGLAGRLEQAKTHRLVYSDLTEAVRLVTALMDE
jgi:hypothetical protein